jgi:uncharacterized RDD family membrane protein YckC
MRCRSCGFTNGEEDHRCLKCGRRIGTAIAAPAGFSGANALAVAPSFDANETQDFQPIKDPVPAQATMFRPPASNLIVFGPRLVPPPKPANPAASADRRQPPAAVQPEFDFLHSTPERVTKSDVPTQIYCDREVATPIHRLVAGAVDTAMVLIAFGIFMGICQLAGAGFGSGRVFWMMLALSFALISACYGLVFAVMGRETAGMHFTHLQLITFDGFPVDGRSRAIRVASTWLSFCSGGLGLIWALAVEETLTWQDHISKTFPTIRETSGAFVR